MSADTAIQHTQVVRTPVRFDSGSAPEVERTFQSLTAQGVTRVVCSLEQTEYISSAALRVLLATAKNLQKLGGGLVLCSPRAYVAEVLETAGFLQILKVCSSEAEALAAIAA